MYGEDKSSIEELTSTITELETLKIEVEPKGNKTIDINNAIDKMKNQIRQVDEELLNTIDIENENSEGQEITFSENSNFDILISNINVLTEKVNDAVKAEADRKAEEERKAKEEAEKKELEETFAKFVGTYISAYGGTSKYTIKADGTLVTSSGNTEKPVSIKKEQNGCVSVKTGTNETVTGYTVEKGYTLYPIGVGARGNTNKIRLEVSDGIAIDEYEKQ